MTLLMLLLSICLYREEVVVKSFTETLGGVAVH